MGPTLGWMMLPVVPEISVISSAALTIPPYASRVLLKAAVKSILLPSVSQWMLASLPQANVAAFDRSLWIKDYIYGASNGAPITIMPDGTDTIDALASFEVISPGALIRLYPLTTADGWYVG